MRNSIMPNMKSVRSQYAQTRSVGLLKKYPQAAGVERVQEKRAGSPESKVFFADNRIIFANRQQQQPPYFAYLLLEKAVS